jgi:hypothetical protein
MSKKNLQEYLTKREQRDIRKAISTNLWEVISQHPICPTAPEENKNLKRMQLISKTLNDLNQKNYIACSREWTTLQLGSGYVQCLVENLDSKNFSAMVCLARDNSIQMLQNKCAQFAEKTILDFISGQQDLFKSQAVFDFYLKVWLANSTQRVVTASFKKCLDKHNHRFIHHLAKNHSWDKLLNACDLFFQKNMHSLLADFYYAHSEVKGKRFREISLS